jgi:hypothetical protein
MAALLQRIERLERMAPPEGGHVFLIGWEGEPISASRGGERIEREPGESVEAFKDRAVERFRSPRGAAMIWLGTGA